MHGTVRFFLPDLRINVVFPHSDTACTHVLSHESRMFYHLNICKKHILAPSCFAWYLGSSHFISFDFSSTSWRPVISQCFFYIHVCTHTLSTFFFVPSEHNCFPKVSCHTCTARKGQNPPSSPAVRYVYLRDQGPKICCCCCSFRLWIKLSTRPEDLLIHSPQLLIRVNREGTLQPFM